ncbi:hypothetical protein ACIPL1_27270 [Pseudomonas sp. NPDC090202]|uniref:hypothetical protein n=1 Tax=Pseudomonas sp. NPDC090202 TaxID=3364476 RepID=UPI00382925B6
MTSQAHEIVFSVNPDSFSRVQALLKRCGHQKLNLLLARGLALVEYVLDEQAKGRSVGSVSASGNRFVPLCERAELLGTGSAPVATNAPSGSAAGGHLASISPNLMPRHRVRVSKVPEAREPRARRLWGHAAFAVNDEAGPVRSLAFHCERNETLGLEQPIEFNGHALPGELHMSHLPELRKVMDAVSMATHFLLCPATDTLSFYGYFPKTGWFRMSRETEEWIPDEAVNAGEVSLFPMDVAELYLRRLRDRPEEPALLQA